MRLLIVPSGSFKFRRDLALRLSPVICEGERGPLFGRKREQRAAYAIALDRILVGRFLGSTAKTAMRVLGRVPVAIAAPPRDRFVANADDEKTAQISARLRIRVGRRQSRAIASATQSFASSVLPSTLNAAE